MARIDFWVSRWPLVMVVALTIMAAPGCVGMAAQLMYMAGLDKIKPECDLSEKRVAVVCVSSRSSYGSGNEAEALSRLISAILQKEVKDIEIVPYREIADWKDNNNWDETNYRDIGRGVKADMLIAIDISSLSYHDGQTLYKGKADIKVTAYDMTKGGKVEFSRDLPDFQFPQQGGRPVTDMAETKFQKLFLTILAKHIARSFHSYDKEMDFGGDAQGLDY
jgi:hypothetical protein